MVPVDLAAAALVALFGAVPTRSLGEVPASLWRAGVAFLVARGVVWLARRSRPNHLKAALPEGLIVVGVNWVVWITLRQVVSAFNGISAIASRAVITDAFLLAFLGGWR